MAAERCLLLSGTPAFAKPSELWPQLSALKRHNDTETGIWCDEGKFMSDYTRKGYDMEGNKAKLAELHTLLTSTVMIRRMKADILKNLPPKIREKAFISIEDENLRNEFVTYMQLLRQGKGVLGKLARVHHQENKPRNGMGYIDSARQNNYPMDDGIGNKEVLHHLYKISGRSKVQRITTMLRGWLKDNTKGKLCIFAHHLEVLDDISNGASLSNTKDSTTRYIRIDGSTSPKARQEQILQFQTDPAVRIAMLGITAAGVAVTLTASSTVWFAELFWTPAIMIQAEDRW
jgi:SWI/SNF-related matrix-associated actin-dependent regulator 1 of chromatin subfamily A